MQHSIVAAGLSRNRQSLYAAMISRDNVVRTVGLALLLTAGPLISSCNRQQSSNGNNSDSVNTADSELNGQEAMQLVKDLIDRNGYSASVSVPYQDYESQTVPCSQGEVEADRSANPQNPELWPCKSPNGSPPYTKRINGFVNKCCKTESVLIHSGDIHWEIPQPATDDKWNIRGIYSVKGQQHSSNWLVDGKSKTIGMPTTN